MPQPRGRFWVIVWLVFALAVLGWVAARQTAAVVTAQTLNDVRRERSVLDARRAELIRRIRAGASRRELVPRAGALGLRLPVDSEIVILPALPDGSR